MLNKFKVLYILVLFIVFPISLICFGSCNSDNSIMPDPNFSPPDTVVIHDTTTQNILIDCPPEVELILYSTKIDQLISIEKDTTFKLFLNIITDTKIFTNLTNRVINVGLNRIIIIFEREDIVGGNVITDKIVYVGKGELFNINNDGQSSSSVKPFNQFFYRTIVPKLSYNEGSQYLYTNGWDIGKRFDLNTILNKYINTSNLGLKYLN